MKRLIIPIFAIICLSSCSVEYNTYECDKERQKICNKETPKAQPVRVVQPVVRTTRVFYNTSPVYTQYSAPVVYRTYNYSRYNRNCSSRIQISYSRPRPVYKYCHRSARYFLTY